MSKAKLKPLYTREVDELCKRVLDKNKVNFLGARSAHDLPPTDSPKPFAIVINTDTMDKKGSHWCAMYVHGKSSSPQTNFGYFFDSYGGSPANNGHVDWRHYLNSVCGHNNWSYNGTQIQEFNTDICGYLCARFLQEMCAKPDRKALFIPYLTEGLVSWYRDVTKNTLST